jgi:hypothetical protein
VDGPADYYLESPDEDALSPLLIKPNHEALSPSPNYQILTHPQFLQTPGTTYGYSPGVGQRRRKNVQYYSDVIINMYQGQKVVSATFFSSILAVLILLGSVVNPCDQ